MLPYLLLFMTVTFAGDWQSITFLSLSLSGFIVAIMYALGFALQNQELSVLAKQEFIQLLVAAIGVLSLLNLTTGIDAVLGTDSWSKAHTTLTNLYNDLSNVLQNLKSKVDDAALQSSKSITCSYGSFMVSISNCGSFYYLLLPLQQAITAVSVAMVEVSALSLLLNMGQGIMFSVFLPMGFFLRTFQITRGAGAVFIAVALTFYALFPFFINMAADFVNDMDTKVSDEFGDLTFVPPSFGECNAYDFGDGNENTVKSAVVGMFFSKWSGGVTMAPSLFVMYLVFVKATLFTVIVLGLTLSVGQVLARALGTYVDFSSLQRLV